MHPTPPIHPTNSLHPSPCPQLASLVNQLCMTNKAYIQIFSDLSYKSEALTKKHAASLYNKMCVYFQRGSIEVINHRKEEMCGIFRDFVREFVGGFVAKAVGFCQQDQQIVLCLIDKWRQFKIFCYFYVFLLKSAESHYETSFKMYRSQAKSNKIQNQDSIFPVPVISLYFFQTIVCQPYIQPILRITRHLLNSQREGKLIERETLRTLFEILYSIGLKQMGRIESVKRENNQQSFEFYATQNKEIQKNYCNLNKNPDTNFFNRILNSVIQDSEHYYTRVFKEKVVICSPVEDFQTVWQILQKQQQMASTYFFNNIQKTAYLNKIKQILILTNLQYRLCREHSLKSLLSKFSHTTDDYLPQLKLFSDTVLKCKSKTIKILQNILRDHILESGKKINQKIAKRREHITEMVALKKAVNRLVQIVFHKDLNLCIVRDKTFKKILDTIEISRNLAEFIDWKVKESIKNKLNDEEINEKLKDAFLILENLVASDSFLIYHQQMLGRRLIEPLNQPRIDIERTILKKISQQLGSISINSSTFMIKDIQRSQQITENYSKKMPFSRFKFNCRIISPQFWTDNMIGNKIQMLLPDAVRGQAETIRRVYHEQYSKYLSWKIQKGFSIFEGTLKTGKIRFQSQNIFMMLLLHIAQGRNHQLPFWQLHKKITKIKDGQNYLIKCVKVLIDNGLVLRGNTNTAQPISENQVLSINLHFKPVGMKPGQVFFIKVSPEMMRSMHESTVENAKIMKDRERLIQSVLVKLLKHSHSTGNNRTSLQQLINGVRDYQFLKNLEIPEQTIKKCLQQLIGRGYCERDERDRKIYRYVA